MIVPLIYLEFQGFLIVRAGNVVHQGLGVTDHLVVGGAGIPIFGGYRAVVATSSHQRLSTCKEMNQLSLRAGFCGRISLDPDPLGRLSTELAEHGKAWSALRCWSRWFSFFSLEIFLWTSSLRPRTLPTRVDTPADLPSPDWKRK